MEVAKANQGLKNTLIAAICNGSAFSNNSYRVEPLEKRKTLPGLRKGVVTCMSHVESFTTMTKTES